LRVYISWLVIRKAKINIKIPGFETKSVDEVIIPKSILLEEFTGVWCGCCPI